MISLPSHLAIRAPAKGASIVLGDVRSVVRDLPTESIDCVVTSPPYWGLRDYGVDGQIGLEQSPDEYVTELVEVFREIRRVLKDDGTIWVNLGDSYAGSANSGGASAKQDSLVRLTTLPTKGGAGIKQKDLVGIPWLVAFALRADGWYLRQDIIWHKPNPMPESVRDRCTKGHEYVFLLSKSPRYYFDADAIKEPAAAPNMTHRSSRKTTDQESAYLGNAPTNLGRCGTTDGLRNKRSVWTVTPKPFRGAHFATMPPDLVEPCILAGCRPGGVVLDPFNGSGTTGVVALRNGREYVGIELNPEYVEIACGRIAEETSQQVLLFDLNSVVAP